MRYSEINRTWVISLVGSKRREAAFFELYDNKIDFEWQDAIRLENGAEGLKKTFKTIFDNALYYEHDNVLIFEDDVTFLYNNAKDMIIDTMRDLPDGYHMCKFGANLLAPVTKVTESLNKISISYALHAALYSREGIEKILEHINLADPIDVIIAKHIEPQKRCYVSSKMIATQRQGKSDIFKFDESRHNLNTIREIYNPATEVVNWHSLMVSQWERNTKHIM